MYRLFFTRVVTLPAHDGQVKKWLTTACRVPALYDPPPTRGSSLQGSRPRFYRKNWVSALTVDEARFRVWRYGLTLKPYPIGTRARKDAGAFTTCSAAELPEEPHRGRLESRGSLPITDAGREGCRERVAAASRHRTTSATTVRRRSPTPPCTASRCRSCPTPRQRWTRARTSPCAVQPASHDGIDWWRDLELPLRSDSAGRPIITKDPSGSRRTQAARLSRDHWKNLTFSARAKAVVAAGAPDRAS